MDCKRVEELLSDYLDGTLEVTENQSMEKHLARCPHCQNEKEKLERTISLIGSLKEVEPPADFASRVRGRLEQESILKRLGRRIFFPLPVKIPLEALAAVLIAATIVYISRPDYSSRRPMEFARQESLRSLEQQKETVSEIEGVEMEERREEIAEAEKPAGPTQSLEQAKEAQAPDLKEAESFQFKARRAEEEGLKAPAEEEAEPLGQSARAQYVDRMLVKDEDKMWEEKAEVSTFTGVAVPTADNYQVRIATDNIQVGLVKAQKAIYLNSGNIISSDEDLVSQIASKDIQRAEILFQVPSEKYEQALNQLKEIGRIVLVLPPKKGKELKETVEYRLESRDGMEKAAPIKETKEYKIKRSLGEKKPTLINVQLELTQSEKE